MAASINDSARSVREHNQATLRMHPTQQLSTSMAYLIPPGVCMYIHVNEELQIGIKATDGCVYGLVHKQVVQIELDRADNGTLYWTALEHVTVPHLTAIASLALSTRNYIIRSKHCTPAIWAMAVSTGLLYCPVDTTSDATGHLVSERFEAEVSSLARSLTLQIHAHA